MQSLGLVVGSLLYLELVAGSLAQKFSFLPVLTRGEYFVCLGAIIFVSVLVIHFTYKEKGTSLVTKSQNSKAKDMSILGGK